MEVNEFPLAQNSNLVTLNLFKKMPNTCLLQCRCLWVKLFKNQTKLLSNRFVCFSPFISSYNLKHLTLLNLMTGKV